MIVAQEFMVLGSLLVIISVCFAQRMPPGVNPQHYQQGQQFQQQGQYQQQYQVPQQVPPQHQQVPQQHQQVPQQHQQVPQQHQQVPMQQQQVPMQNIPQQQQVPVQPQQGGHGHGHGHQPPQPGQLLNAANIAHEKEHIQEHLEVPIDTSKMTEQELQFHYFKMHDADNNNKLDGCELIKSLIHWHDPESRNTMTVISDEDLAQTVDLLLDGWDLNKDGFVDYTEFKMLSRN